MVGYDTFKCIVVFFFGGSQYGTAVCLQAGNPANESFTFCRLLYASSRACI